MDHHNRNYLYAPSSYLPRKKYRAIHQDSPVLIFKLFAKFGEFVSYKLNFWSNDYLYGSFARFDNTSNTSRFDYFITDCSNIFYFKS